MTQTQLEAKVPNMERINALTLPEVVAMIFAKRGDRSLRQYAIELGVSAMYLSDVINGKREPGRKLLAPLGVRKIRSVFVRYERVSKTRKAAA